MTPSNRLYLNSLKPFAYINLDLAHFLLGHHKALAVFGAPFQCAMLFNTGEPCTGVERKAWSELP
jgi:hypothetical protein